MEMQAEKWQDNMRKSLPWPIRSLFDVTQYPVYKFISSASRKIKPGSYVLDAGAGECTFKDLFVNMKYVSIDFKKGDPSCRYRYINIVGDLLRLPFLDGTFDAVLCTQVLEHLAEPKVFLLEIRRILKDKGVLYLTAPQQAGQHQKPYDYFRYTSFGLEYLFRTAGFKDIEIVPLGGFFKHLAVAFQHMPTVIFSRQNDPLVHILLLPLKAVVYFLCCIIVPVILNPLDILDKHKDTVTNYACRCVKY